MNSVNLTGRITADPKLQKTASGKSVCHFNIAINRKYNKEKTDFIHCTAWAQSAEYLCQYGKKGMNIGVNGSLQVNNYNDQNGNPIEKMAVMAESVEIMFDRKPERTTMDYDPVFDETNIGSNMTKNSAGIYEPKTNQQFVPGYNLFYNPSNYGGPDVQNQSASPSIDIDYDDLPF